MGEIDKLAGHKPIFSVPSRWHSGIRAELDCAKLGSSTTGFFVVFLRVNVGKVNQSKANQPLA